MCRGPSLSISARIGSRGRVDRSSAELAVTVGRNQERELMSKLTGAFLLLQPRLRTVRDTNKERCLYADSL